ncbi:hypothetical protein [Streptomyces sp. NPDC059564]
MPAVSGDGGAMYSIAELATPGPRVLVLPALLRMFAPTHIEAAPAP